MNESASHTNFHGLEAPAHRACPRQIGFACVLAPSVRQILPWAGLRGCSARSIPMGLRHIMGKTGASWAQNGTNIGALWYPHPVLHAQGP